MQLPQAITYSSALFAFLGFVSLILNRVFPPKGAVPQGTQSAEPGHRSQQQQDSSGSESRSNGHASKGDLQRMEDKIDQQYQTLSNNLDKGLQRIHERLDAREERCQGRGQHIAKLEERVSMALSLCRNNADGMDPDSEK